LDNLRELSYETNTFRLAANCERGLLRGRAGGDWLCRAFGFEVRVKIEGEGGSIEHSELTYGEGLIMVGHTGLANKLGFRKSPRTLGGSNTQNMMVLVDDADAHCEYARGHGAKIIQEPTTTDYGRVVD
jgi:uncharacterized glyoxalase superfamily protein PhnB